jgi:thiamine biosynthesis lipoprotein
MQEADLRFPSMGSRMRLIVGHRTCVSAEPPAERAERLRGWLHDYDRRLSRFRADSELNALNADPRSTVPASPLLRGAVKAGLWAAETSGGLVDPTLVDAIEHAGYEHSLAGAAPAPLRDALAGRPPVAPARPDPRRRWRLFSVDDDLGSIRRPAGIRFDTGGAGKGHAADLAAGMLRDYARFVVDCGGDVRIGGPGAAIEPYELEVRHPLGGIAHRMRVSTGGVATSGIERRIWRQGERFAHHLLDPASGEPAWTGLLAATAVAASALEAEVLAKTAFLSGPDVAASLLRARGGVLVHEDGSVEAVGAAASGQIGPRVVVSPEVEAA